MANTLRTVGLVLAGGACGAALLALALLLADRRSDQGASETSPWQAPASQAPEPSRLAEEGSRIVAGSSPTSTLSSMTEEQMRESLQLAVSTAVTAMENEDYATLVGLFQLIAIDVEAPSRIVTSETHSAAIVPYVMYADLSDPSGERARLVLTSYLFVVSPADGPSWKCIEGGSYAEVMLRDRYEGLLAGLELPARRMVVGAPDGTGLVLEQVEKEGRWELTERSRDELLAILRHSRQRTESLANGTETDRSGSQLTEQTLEPQTECANRYSNEEYGFSICFPPDWELKTSGVEGTLIKARRRDDQGRLAFLAVAVQELGVSGDMWDLTGEDWVEMVKADVPYADMVLLDWGRIAVAGEHALWARTEVRRPAILSGLSISYLFMHGENLFRLTGSTDRDTEWYEENEPAFKEAIKTFHFE